MVRETIPSIVHGWRPSERSFECKAIAGGTWVTFEYVRVCEKHSDYARYVWVFAKGEWRVERREGQSQ